MVRSTRRLPGLLVGGLGLAVGLDLDRRPEKYVAVLQVGGRRCSDDASMPSH